MLSVKPAALPPGPPLKARLSIYPICAAQGAEGFCGQERLRGDGGLGGADEAVVAVLVSLPPIILYRSTRDQPATKGRRAQVWRNF